MIALSFPNPNKKITHHIVGKPPWIADLDKARALGISSYEYGKRCAIVDTALKSLDYDKGDIVFPYNASLFHKHGKAVVVGVCRKYDDYGDAKWEDQTPLLIAASWVDTPNEVFNCTIGYLQKLAPHGVKE